MINKAFIIGRLTKDIELKITNAGVAVASFVLASTRNFKANGEELTDFISCQAWRNTATYLEKYTKKGDLIAVDGRIQTRNYENQQGNKVYITELIVENAQILNTSRAKKSDELENQFNDFDTGNENVNISNDDLPF